MLLFMCSQLARKRLRESEFDTELNGIFVTCMPSENIEGYTESGLGVLATPNHYAEM